MDEKKIVSCGKCKCLLNKNDAFIVDVVSVTFREGKIKHYYCLNDAPKYNFMVIWGDGFKRFFDVENITEIEEVG